MGRTLSKVRPAGMPRAAKPPENGGNRLIAHGVALALALASGHALAQQPAAKRLSDWLLEQPYTPDAYPLGLSWLVANEVPTQYAVQQELLQGLAGARPDVRANAEAMARMRAWLSLLPITGRVPVAVADARWLQANPLRDPVLLANHTVVLPRRPKTVTVVRSDGSLCNVTHARGREADAYLAACAGDAARADWVWIAQPDGRMQRFGVAAWNREPQDEPAPGAWLWAPGRNSGWPEWFSKQLITFLATQGPAPDAATVSEAAHAPAAKPRPRQQSRRKPPAGGSSPGFGVPPQTIQLPPAGNSPAIGTTPGFEVSRSMVDAPPPPTALPSRGLDITSGDWGTVGLLQTPTARMRPAGNLSFTYSRTQPYTRQNIIFQPLDWLEVGFRYVDVSNRPYDPSYTFSTQSYKDKSFDAKLRLWPESAYLPEVAVGSRDLAGTGLFSSEFLVASKRWNMLDFSLGAGWGYIAGQQRSTAAVGQGGLPGYKNYFRGSPRPFGGVQYQTPWEKVSLKLEYDSNSFQSEPLTNNQRRRSPWNVGMVYRAGKNADITVGYERGNTVVLGLSLHTQLDGLSTLKVSDPPRGPVEETRPKAAAADWSTVTKAVEERTGWHVDSIERGNRELRLKLDDADAPYWRYRLDRATAVLHAAAPPDVDRFVYTYRANGNGVAEHVVERDVWVKEQTQPLPPGDRQASVIARAPTQAEAAAVLQRNPKLRFEYDYFLGFMPTFGGPNSFMLYQVYAGTLAKLWVRDDTWVQGSLRLRLLDNYNTFTFTGPSNLPRVRTFQREYLTTSRITLPNLQATHTGKFNDSNYYSVYGGLLEDMFGGVGGEWLYRPFASRLAFGIDANWVHQRDFHQDFRFRDYKVKTGHATAYWDTGWNDVIAKVSAGQYLAGDKGITVDLSRRWSNGVTLGVFATKTNVSSEQFGEGSFDKGIYMSIPLESLLTRSSKSTLAWAWRPLTRDGGAKLARWVELYDYTRARSDRTLETRAAPQSNENVPPADRRDNWAAAQSQTVPSPVTVAKPVPAPVEPGTSAEYRLIEALYQQGYRNTTVQLDQSGRLNISLTHEQIAPVSRAVGRAARTVLPLVPDSTRGLNITFVGRGDPIARYEFFDVEKLRRFYSGAISGAELVPSVSVEWLNPGARVDNPLAQLDDTEAELKPGLFTSLTPEGITLKRVGMDFVGAGRAAKDVDWVTAGLLTGATLFAASRADRRVDKFFTDHAGNQWIKNSSRVGNALPWIGLAGSALLALDTSDPTRSRTAFSATEAGVTALALATGLKYAVGRSRPTDNLGYSHFNSFSSSNSNSSFPSRHSAVAWAVVTPYALQYDMPWLYGAALLTNLGRVGSREHWLSDTAAGALIGYGVGRLFWEASRRKNEPRVMLGHNAIYLSWDNY